LSAPTAPTRAGYTFEGWFRGRPGLTWLEPEATSFPLTVSANDKFYAYWEPINSKTVNYANGETYFTSLNSDTGARFNPMTYLYSHENSIMADMSTPLFTTEVDWDLAMSQGVSDFIGDFSKIESREYSIDALDFANILVGATSFPKDIDGDEWIDKLDLAIEIASDPKNKWIKVRNFLLEHNVPLFDIMKLENEYVKLLIQGKPIDTFPSMKLSNEISGDIRAVLQSFTASIIFKLIFG
jgi:uncharacterized repeat protein (TIGR02543 family)